MFPKRTIRATWTWTNAETKPLVSGTAPMSTTLTYSLYWRQLLFKMKRLVWRCWSSDSGCHQAHCAPNSTQVNYSCSPKLSPHQSGLLCSRKRSQNFSICLIAFLLVILFCLSMSILIQIFLLSSSRTNFNKLLIESFFTREFISSLSAPKNYSKLFDEEVEEFMSRFTDYPSDSVFQQNLKFTIKKEGSDYFDYWQPVHTSTNKFFVYSAFVDTYNRSNLNKFLDLDSTQDDLVRFVRVLAVTQLLTKEKVICSYHSHNNGSNYKTKRLFREGKLRAIREHWNLKYSAFFIYCPLPKSSSTAGLDSQSLIATHVSIFTLSNMWNANVQEFVAENFQLLQSIVPSNQLRIHEHKRKLESDRPSIAVCVKPLHYRYNKSINLIEFMELNTLLGVQHYYFYNHTIGTEVDFVLRKYAQNFPGLITVSPWLLPIKSQAEIRTEGIFAALNDCLYRARMDAFDYVLFIDLDEFIIPHQHYDLTGFIRDVRRIYPSKVGAYSFRNGFFYLQQPDDTLSQFRYSPHLNLARHLTTISKTRRKLELNIHRQRSKCIVMPEYTVEMGNHFVWEFVAGRHTLNMDAAIAYLHHYRVCEFGGDDCIRHSEPFVDQRAHLWSWKLILRVEQRLKLFCKNFQNSLQICSLVQ